MRSYSRPGESLIFFTMKDSAPVKEVPETWYQVRKKVGDIAATLPQGVQGPFFNDEFGDVYTNIYALEGDGFSPAQLHDYADQLRTVLLRVPGVGKVDYFGDPDQHIYVEISNAQLTRLAHHAAAARARRSTRRTPSRPSARSPRPTTACSCARAAQFKDVQALADTLIRINNRTFRLGDIATIKRGYDDPPVTQMRVGGQAVLGIGVTMQPGGDVIVSARRSTRKAPNCRRTLPAGLQARRKCRACRTRSRIRSTTSSKRSPKRSRSCWS